MSPRPILKTAPSHRDDPNSELPFYGINAVHFPPRTSLTHVFDAHSSSYYDRSPIIVSPNSCALPERGCPGRTYTLDDPTPSACNTTSKIPSTPRGGHVHPRVLAQYQAQSYSYPSGAERSSSSMVPPPLIPDLSSESEESDGFISPPPESSSYFSGSRTPRSPYSPRNDKYPSQYSYDNAYPAYGNPHSSYPTVSTTTSYSQPPPSPESRNRHRRERERERDHRIRKSTAAGEIAADDPGYDDDRDVPNPSSSSTLAPRRSRCRKSMSKTSSSFCEHDDNGCLGGF